MSDPSTQRLVKYMLTVEVSPDAEQQQKRFKEFMKLTQTEVDQAVKDSANARVEAEKTAADRITEMQRDQLRVLEDIQKQSTTLVEMQLTEQQRLEEEAAKAREEREKDSLQRIQDQYEKHTKTVKQSARELTDGYLQATEGLITLSQGAASIGVLAEEDAEKMLRLIVTIRGVADVAKGGVELYRGISAAVDAYRASVLAAAAAEEALNAARARGAGAGVAGATGNTVSGFLGGASSSTALGGLSAALFSLPGAIAAAIVGTLGAGAMATNVGGIRDRTANAIPLDWVDPNSNFGWAAGGIGSIGDFGFGGVTARNASSLMFGGLSPDIFGGIAAEQARAQAAAEATQQGIAKRQSRLDQEANENAKAQMQFELEQQAYQMRRQRELTVEDLLGGPTADSVLERLSRAQGRLQDANYQRSVADATPNDVGQIERTTKLQIQALEEVIALRRQALALQQQEGQQALAVAKEETREIEHQLEMKKAEQQRIESQLMSARQRFGQMNEAMQAQAIAAFQKAQSGGSLNREESSLLRSVGTQEAIQFAEDADLARADAGNFQIFQQAAQATVQQMAREKMKLQVELAQKQDIQIQFKNDMEAIQSMGQQVADIVVPQMKELAVLQQQAMENAINAKASRENVKFSAGPMTGSGL